MCLVNDLKDIVFMKDILMGLSDVCKTNANCIIHNNDVAMTNQSINQSINDVYS